jgi:asparagine synthase (glutamine-hydrolysing)
MSAFSCIYRSDGQPVETERMENMVQAGHQFGVDTQGTWVDSNIGLGYCGLWTVQESVGEKQPVCDIRSGVRIVGDIRIDNQAELRNDLKSADPTLQPQTDAELVLASYSIWGIKCVERLVGDFAFALWDRNKSLLFCARDALGIRPLFYSLEERKFVCGSLLRQVLKGGELPRDLDEEYMGRFLVRGDCPSELTAFKKAQRLLGGWAITIEHGKFRKFKYWDLNPRTTIRYYSDGEYEDHFKAVFRSSVQDRLRCVGSIAADLSGGLDSSSIVCMAQEIYRSGPIAEKGFFALTHSFDRAFEANENEWSREVIRKYDLNVAYVSGDGHWPLRDNHENHPYWDEPTIKGLFTALFSETGRTLQRRNARVLLSGIGGDQVFLGDSNVPMHLADLFRSLRWRQLSRELVRWQRDLNETLAHTFVDNCIMPFRYPNSMVVPFAWRICEVPDWIDNKFLRKHDLPRFTVVHGFLPRLYKSPAAQRQYLLIKRTSAALLQSYLLGNEVEMRFPFLDRRLVEFAMAIPMDQKLRTGCDTRSILRRAMRGILPEKIRTRAGKGQFDRSISIGFEKERKFVSRLTKSSCLASMGLIDVDKFRKAWECAYIGETRQIYLFMAALSLEIWVRAFLRGQSDGPLQPCSSY